jgi:hypothetical protein
VRPVPRSWSSANYVTQTRRLHRAGRDIVTTVPDRAALKERRERLHLADRHLIEIANGPNARL